MVKPATNYKGATDEGLADLIQQWEKDRSRHMDMLNAIEADLANFRAELVRRKIAAFWQANEGLRLEVGDALLVTDEAYTYLYPVEQKHYKVGQVVEFRYVQIEPEYTNSYMHVDFRCINCGIEAGYSGSVPLDIARRMRLAWLQAHGEAQP